MACRKCNQPKTTCTCNTKPTFCGCSTRVDAKCVSYNGCNLTPLGVIGGDNLEDILYTLNEFLKEIQRNVDQAFIGVNVGLGAELYRGEFGNNKQFRTLVKGDGILIEQKDKVIEIGMDLKWLESKLKEFAKTDWFLENIKNLLKKRWFVDFLQNLFQQQWFGDVIANWVRQQWFTNYLIELFKQKWFADLLMSLFYTSPFQQFFARYITNLFNTGQIDICELIKKCGQVSPPQPPVNQNPVFTGDVVYTVENRGNKNVVTSDFTSKYFDADGDEFVSIRITGGDLQNITKMDGTPLRVGDEIPVSQIHGLRFQARDQDWDYTQVVNFVAVSSNGKTSS